MKLYTYALLLTCCSSIMSMTPDKQLVPLAHGKLDPLKSKIMSKIDGFQSRFTTAESVLRVINQCTDKESKAINWVKSVEGLKQLEKSQSLSKRMTSFMTACSLLNMAWLGYPLINKSLGAGSICLYKEMDELVLPVVCANFVTLCFSLVMLSAATSCCRPSERLTKKLHGYIKEQASLGNDVTVEGLKPIIAEFTRKSTSLYGKFLEAAQFAELPDGSLDIAQFEKVFPRSYGLESDKLRPILMLSFLASVIPSAYCGPAYQYNDNIAWLLLGVPLAYFNGLLAMANVSASYPGAEKQVSTDIRSVINLIQDHLDEQALSADMV